MRLAVVTGSATGAQEFINDAWQGGDVFIDEQESVKRAFGGVKVKGYWILKPTSLAKILGYAKRYGHFEGDITDKTTNMLGGTVVLDKGGNVVYSFRETKSFDNGSAQAVLDAVRAHKS